MRALFSTFLFCFFLHQGLSQDVISFNTEVLRIDSLIDAGAFEDADTALVALKSELVNTSLLKEDTVRLYFSSKRAFIANRLGDCLASITLSKEDLMLKREVYGEGDPATLAANRNLGIYYLNCDSLEESKAALKKTLEVHEKEIGIADELYARTLDDLAYVEGKLGNDKIAYEYYDRLLELLADSKGPFYQYVIENYSALLISNEAFDEATPFFDQLKESMATKAEYPQFLKDYYNVFVHNKDYVKALESAGLLLNWCDENSTVCDELEIDIAKFTLSSARLSLILGNEDQSLGYYKLAEQHYQDSAVFPRMMLEQSTIYAQMGRPIGQLGSLNKAIIYHRSSNTTDSATYHQAVTSLGKLYTVMGRFSEADNLFSTDIEDWENSEGRVPKKLAYAYQSVGNQQLLLQNFKQADSFFAKSESVFRANDLTETEEYASLLNSYGALYESLANYRKAEKNYREALRIISDELTNLRTTLASNLANIILRRDPQNDSVAFLLSKAIDWQLAANGEMHPEMANLLASRGVYYLGLDRNDEALQDLERSVEIFDYTVEDDYPLYLSALSNLGLVYDALEENSKAESTLKRTVALYEKYFTKTNPGYIRTLNNLANYYARVELYEKAEPIYVQLSENQIKDIAASFTYLSESEKRTFVAEKQKLLNNFKAYVVARSVNDEADVHEQVIKQWYNLELSTKGILLNSTKKVREAIFNGGDQELIDLFSKWALTRKQIADMSSLKNEQLSGSTSYDSLLEVTNELEKALSRKSEAFLSAFSSSTPTFDNVRNQLQPNEATVEIIRTEINGEGYYTALVGIKKSAFPKLIVLGKGIDFEQRGFKLYKNSIGLQLSDSRSFGMYWQKINDYLKANGINKIYYAPDGVYHKISLATLLDPNTKEYLIDQYSIIQLSSTKELLNRKSQLQYAPNSALLVGRPKYKLETNEESVVSTRGFDMLNEVGDLPGTEEEINEINKLLAKQALATEIVLGEEATEARIKKLLNRELVHIATHGFFFEEKQTHGLDPMLSSGLLLAGVSNQNGDLEDGVLTAYEIMNLNLPNLNTVVLSACETGLGEIASGEGIYGLQRSFLVGGAETLIMSLWKVDDVATKDLMIDFYKALIKSGDKRQAFLDAQKKVKKKYKDPIYWGAFVMIGI